MADVVKHVCEQWISAGYGDDCFWENWPDCPCEDSLTPNQVMAAVTKLENENQQMREALEKDCLYWPLCVLGSPRRPAQQGSQP